MLIVQTLREVRVLCYAFHLEMLKVVISFVQAYILSERLSDPLGREIRRPPMQAPVPGELSHRP